MPIYGDQFKTYKGNANLFIETGTHMADGILKSLEAGYTKVITFEIDPHFYNCATNRMQTDEKAIELSKGKDVNLVFGDSTKLLPAFLKEINEPYLLWADSHFCTAVECEFTPLVHELELIKQYSKVLPTILIDDVRLMTADSIYVMPWKTEFVMQKVKEISSTYRFEFTDGFCENDILVCIPE